MAIEKVLIMNTVGKREDTDAFALKLKELQDIQLMDTLEQIEAGRFTLTVNRENMDELLGFNALTAGYELYDEKPYIDRSSALNEKAGGILKAESGVSSTKLPDHKMVLSKADAVIYGHREDMQTPYDIQNEIDRLTACNEALNYLSDLDVSVKALFGMEHFHILFGSLTNDNAERLNQLSDVMTSVVYPLGSVAGNQREKVFLILTPYYLEVETTRLLKSLGFKAITEIDTGDDRLPSVIIRDQEKEIKRLETKRNDLISSVGETKGLQQLYNDLCLCAGDCMIKKKMAFSDEKFYCSGWIPADRQADVQALIAEFEQMQCQFIEPASDTKPPTKLKNKGFFRPFENLIAMYGAPAYNELDPTTFLAITYMLCFGFMFGDVGQGLVLLIGGIFAAKKLHIELGNVVARMAISSIIFGFLYGSVFGNETLLPALWMRPMSNITTALIGAVIMGVLMLMGGYIYNILNSLMRKDIQNGLFGPNGMAGLILFISVLGFVVIQLGYAAGLEALGTPLLIVIILMVIVILFREPLANTIKKRPLYDESASDYYIDAGFGIFEMALSMLSNTVSFIRVGAFALTHAGMFLAFETLSEMVGGGIGGVIIMIIGNIFIIVMEGLIDFIQCLRLQFYELFSKYYQGDGEAFVSVTTEIQRSLA